MTLKLKKYQIVSLFNTIRSLDKKASNGPTDDFVTSPYKFKAAAIYALSKNLRKVTAEVSDIEKMRLQLFEKYKTTSDDKELTGDAGKQFVKEYNEFIESETEIDLHPVKLSDLDLNNNNVPVKTLTDLLDIIVED